MALDKLERETPLKHLVDRDTPYTYYPGDFLDTIVEELNQARKDAAMAVDRVKALEELRGLLIELGQRTRGSLRPEDLMEDAEDEYERAAITALLERCIRPDNH